MSILVATPDGHTAEFPDGTDPSVIQSVMAKQFGGPKQEDKTGSAAFNPTDGNSFLQNLMAGAGQGLTDAGTAASQFLAHSPGVSMALGQPPVPGELAPLIDEQAKDKAKIDAPLLKTGGGVVGNLAAQGLLTAPIGGEAGTLANIIKTGAKFGGAGALLTPVTDSGTGTPSLSDLITGNKAQPAYWEQKLKQVAEGTGIGAATAGGLGVAGKVATALLPGNLIASAANLMNRGANKSDFAKEGEALAARTGIDMTPGQISGGKAQTTLENVARQSIMSKSAAFEGDTKIGNQWVDYVNRTIDGITQGGGSPAEIGERVQGVVKNAVSDLTKARDTQAAADYGQVNNLLKGQKGGIVPQNYMQTLQELSQEFAGGPEGSDYAKLSKALNGLQDTQLQNADLNTMLKTRRFLSQVSGGQVQLAGDTGRSMQKRIAAQLLGAIDGDLDAAGDKLGGDVGSLLKQANANYRDGSQRIEGLQNSALGKLVGQDFAEAIGSGSYNNIPGETVMARLRQLPPSQIAASKKLLQSSDPDAWQAVKGSLLQNALEQAQHAPASAGANALPANTNVFVSALAKTPQDQARLAHIFEPGELNQVQDALNAARRLGDRTGTNFSGTGPYSEINAMTSAATHALINPATGVPQLAAMLATPRAMARVIANSQGRAAIQQLSRLPLDSERARKLTAQISALAAEDVVNAPAQ